MSRAPFVARRRAAAAPDSGPEIYGGIRFPSGRTAKRYRELEQLALQGHVLDLHVSTKPGAGVLLFTGTFTYIEKLTGRQKVERTRANKYGAEKETIDGITFDSRREARRYRLLRAHAERGLIRDLALQVPFEIHAAAAAGVGPRIARYIADFVYIDLATGERRVEDCKGLKTPVYRLKKKLVEAEHGIAITEI